MDPLSPIEQKQAPAKEVAKYARPHIETHVRSKGHSSVAGAAYRLGLKLLDERTGTWHDYSRRSTNGEIVLALTVAPEGSPEWAIRPQELWSRVENAERRKDSQVARDFRVPLALGLSPDQACALAQQMGEFIAETLKTPVSIGVHRDSSIDVLGEKKASEKVGYHAHLYFPTRRLACFEESEGEGAVGRALEMDGGGTGFGAKLTVLSNKRTSSAFVELLNAKWAELSNTLCEEVGLPPIYDHRSYVRQGIDLTPQPTVGQAATALERRGVETRRGNQLREALTVSSGRPDGVLVPTTELLPSLTAGLIEADPMTAGILVAQPPEASTTPQTPVLPVQLTPEPDFSALTHGNVVFLQRLREFRQPGAAQSPITDLNGVTKATVPVGLFPGEPRRLPLITVPIERPQRRKDDHPKAQATSAAPREDTPTLEVLARRHRLRLVVMKKDSIASRLEKVLPLPLNASEKERFRQGLVLVQMLETVLATLEAAEEDKEKKEGAYERARAAALDADYRVDQARAGRRTAQNRLDLWERNRTTSKKLFGGLNTIDARKAALQEDVRKKNELVQAAKRASKALHAFSQEALRALMRIQAFLIEIKRDLAVTAVDLRSRNTRLFEEFSKWLCVSHRRMLDAVMPGTEEGELAFQDSFDSESDGKGGNRQGGSKANGPVHQPAAEQVRKLRR